MAQHPPQDEYDTRTSSAIDQPPSYEDAVDTEDFREDVHLATLEEKKRRWWRNALINLLCIGSWYVLVISKRKMWYLTSVECHRTYHHNL